MLALLLLFPFLLIVNTTNLAGTTTFLPAWSRLSSSYRQTKLVELGYIPGSTPTSITNLLSGNVEVALIEVSLEDLIATKTSDDYGKIVGIPFLGQSFSMIYNIPELNGANSILVLNWTVLVDILMGRITRWNDSALVSLNPQLENVTKDIIFIHRKMNSGTTVQFTSTLSSVSSEWKEKYGRLLLWPDELLNSTNNILTTTHVFSVFAEVFSLNYSMSVGVYPFFYSIAFTRGVNFAAFQRPDGTIAYPNDTAGIKASFEGLQWDLGQPLQGLGPNATWPFMGMGYFTFPKDTSVLECANFLNVLRFVRWCYTSPDAFYVTETVGYYLPPKNLRDKIVQYLESIKCDTEVVLKVNIIKPSNTGRIVMTIIYWVTSLLAILILAFMKIKKPVARVYSIILIFGLLLCGCAMVFWVLTPEYHFICICRWWLMGLGLVVFSGGVFCRSYQLKKIHALVKSGRFQSTKNIDHIKLLTVSMGVITLIELVLLILLQTLVPLYSGLNLVNYVTLDGEHQCDGTLSLIWMGVQSAYLFCILVLGVYSMYSTWGISSSVDDTRINVLMIFICLVALGVGDVIMGYSDKGEEIYSWWALTIVMIWSFCMMFSIFLPKIVKNQVSRKTVKDSELSPR